MHQANQPNPEIRLHILSYVCPETIIIRDKPQRRRNFHAQNPPHLVTANFKPILGALKTCKTLHIELSEILYTNTTFYLPFGYYWPREEYDRQTTHETNVLARFVRQIGSPKAASLAKLVLVFEHGFDETDPDSPVYDDMYPTSEVALEVLRRHMPMLKELVLIFEAGNCVSSYFGETIDRSEELLSWVLSYVEDLRSHNSLRSLRKLMVEGLPKKGEDWEEIRKLEMGVVRRDDGAIVKGSWGKNFY